MIIKLTDADINVAQDDETEEGIIKIPDNLWNHIIQAVEHPTQEFVNSLYINVNDLTIGGSGLPITIYSFQCHSTGTDASDIINTWDMTAQTGGHYNLPTNRVLIAITQLNNQYKIILRTNDTGSTKFVNFDSDAVTRYYVVSPKSSHELYRYCTFYNDQNTAVFELFDTSSTDDLSTFVTLNPYFIDFLWINN